MKLWVEDDNGVMIEVQEIKGLGNEDCLLLQFTTPYSLMRLEEVEKYVRARTTKNVILLPHDIKIIGTI